MGRFTLDEILVLTTVMYKLTPNEMQVLVRAVMKLTLDEPNKTAVGDDYALSSHEILENRRGEHPDAKFVGGFQHRPANPDAGRASASTTPPAFSTPVNQIAVPKTPSPSGSIPCLPRMNLPTPESAKAFKHPNPLSGAHSVDQPRKNELSASPPRLQATSSILTPSVSPETQRASSSGESNPEKAVGDKSMQCSAVTNAGKRCKNMVQAYPPLKVVDPDLPVVQLCHAHKMKVLTTTTGFNSRKTDEWIKYKDYIPSYLHPDTQVALRCEMWKPLSKSDEPGYVYCYEIRDLDAPNIIKLKVGRTVTLQGRLNDWQKQCRSKEQVLHGWWPGNIADEDLQTSLLPGLIDAGEKGRFCHKLERLVHIELADLIVHTPYLNKGFPNISNSKDQEGGHSNPDTLSKKGKCRNNGATALNAVQQGNKPCPDCGLVHKEIFPFLRPDDSPYKNQEYEKLVKPVIEKWGQFVDTFV